MVLQLIIVLEVEVPTTLLNKMVSCRVTRKIRANSEILYS